MESGDLRRLRRRLRHAHRALVPAVALVQRDVVRVRPGALLVHEPVVHHELDPRRGDHVEDRGRLKRRPRQELEADLARARRHEVRGVGERLVQRDVASEPHAGTSHARAGEVVVRAVARARVPHGRPGPARPRFRAAAPRCREGSSRAARSRGSNSFTPATASGNSYHCCVVCLSLSLSTMAIGGLLRGRRVAWTGRKLGHATAPGRCGAHANAAARQCQLGTARVGWATSACPMSTIG